MDPRRNRPRPHRTRRRGWVLMGVVASLGLGACELQEVSVVDVEDVLVAEVYVNLDAERPGNGRVFAFLHGTLGGAGSTPPGEAFDATVSLTRSDGLVLPLILSPEGSCLEDAPTAPGACFAPADSTAAGLFDPGDRLEAHVELSDGRVLFGATTVPGAFQLDAISNACRLDPDTLMPIAWTRSEGAWAYINETVIRGLADLLEPEGIEASNHLYLLGLSVSAADTTIVFPSEFGLFDRFDLDQALAVRLQTGLPPGTLADVAITAVDRNYVNWVRGGSFNPSGQVRVPSLQGDGTGVFASTLSHRFGVVVLTEDPEGRPDCPTG
jgi:hypothetical protein